MIRPIITTAFIAIGLLTGVATAQAQQQASNRPVLKAEAIITGDIVRIGDLVENAGVVASVPIFRAPDLGCTGTVSVDAVLEAVRDHALIGVDTAGLREIVVTRASRAIPEKNVEDLMTRALSARFNLGPAKDIVVNFARDIRTIYVEPSSSAELKVAHIDYDARSGRFDAIVEVPAGAGRRNILRLAGRAFATVETATVTRTIERGAVLKDADIVVERRPRSEVGRDVITRREDAVGLAARVSLQPGRPLRPADVMQPDLVQRNETVTLVYEVPGITLTIRGRAAEGGVEGDVINVLNEQSRRTVQGVIIGPGRVAVTNGSPRLAANQISRSATNANMR
ncbi:MAG TPA: flagellar basal body P-ring formation chaperone FlgA [Pseudolabrys sp.]|nr:flagellar basal body P-ring formation chaperone FlgA [Pseudolabrys sp.]